MDEKIFALTPLSEGAQCTVELDGKIYKRVVRYRRDVGLYIVMSMSLIMMNITNKKRAASPLF